LLGNKGAFSFAQHSRYPGGNKTTQFSDTACAEVLDGRE
jgi:hypothetical protein